MSGVVAEISSQGEFSALYSGHAGLSVILLWAPWHPPSVNLTKVLDALAVEHKSARFGKVNADVCPAMSKTLGADQVPFIAFIDPNGKQLDSIAGSDPPRLVAKMKALAGRHFDKMTSAPSGGGEASAQAGGGDLNAKLKELVKFSPVMLFMKGSQSEPFCKFSKQAVAMLDKHSIEYSTFDILQDDEVRNGLKEYSNWKTYPQFYINGDLIGGVDIMKEMEEDGSLVEACSGPGKAEEESLEQRLKKLINKEQVMLFMKGNPEQPQCGFSGKTCSLLKENNIEFGTFDILSDEDVRQGLKSYSNWPTYPQLYSGGKLIGGLDILKELADEGSLREELGLS